ncbi:MAG: RNA polymerase sigma-70 factor [Dyadobacter fermentans]
MPFSDPIRHHLDKQSFERIYNQNWAKLYSIALCRLEDEDLAKELVQTIFVSLWERRESLVIEGNVSHYLTRAMKLKVLEYFRVEQLHDQHLGEMARLMDRQENTTENLVLLDELRGRVQQLSSSLPCQCRRVFELSRVQGLNTREIAMEMVISEKTVKNHLTRALSFLKLML